MAQDRWKGKYKAARKTIENLRKENQGLRRKANDLELQLRNLRRVISPDYAQPIQEIHSSDLPVLTAMDAGKHTRS